MKTGMTHQSIHHKLPRAITFDPIVGFSRSIHFQTQEVKNFSGVSRSIQGPSPPQKNSPRAINSPRHPTERENTLFFSFSFFFFFLKFVFYPASLHVFSLFQTTKNTKNTHQSFLILFSSPKYKVLFLYPTFLSLVLHLGFEV